MGVYNHCKYRNSYDCADGYCNCEICESFSLDFEQFEFELLDLQLQIDY